MLRALVLAAVIGLPAHGEPVDIELALLVDVSRSMTPAELDLQRRGYAAALTSPEVLGAIGEGYLGRIALAYIEWAGPTSQRVVVDWTVIAGAADARRVADALAADFTGGLHRTSISAAIDFGTRSILQNGYEGQRLVLDVSGDGPNNQGPPVTEARDRAVALGLVVNGLPIMTGDTRYSRFQYRRSGRLLSAMRHRWPRGLHAAGDRLGTVSAGGPPQADRRAGRVRRNCSLPRPRPRRRPATTAWSARSSGSATASICPDRGGPERRSQAAGIRRSTISAHHEQPAGIASSLKLYSGWCTIAVSPLPTRI